MKKKIFALTIVFVFLTTLMATAYAISPVKIVFDGDELSTDAAPLIENGRVMVPLRVISEKLGAEVIWDAETKTVRIYSAQPQKVDTQAAALERALAAKDSVSAAQTWAEGVKTRNGALQYAVMTPELKKENYQELSEGNWSTGTSSPWVETFEINEISIIDDQMVKYEVVFTYTDSTRNTFTMREYITVKLIDQNWYVSSIEKVDLTGKITKTLLDNDGIIKGILVENEQQKGTSYDKANVLLTAETQIYKGHTNELLSVDSLQVGTNVEISFAGHLLMSYPVQGGAEIIRVY